MVSEAELLEVSAKPRGATKEGRWVLRTPQYIQAIFSLLPAY